MSAKQKADFINTFTLDKVTLTQAESAHQGIAVYSVSYPDIDPFDASYNESEGGPELMTGYIARYLADRLF